MYIRYICIYIYTYVYLYIFIKSTHDFHIPCFRSAILLLAEPGDLILWDSRTIHGGHVGSSRPSRRPESAELARMSVTVCMVPRSKATPEVPALENDEHGIANVG